jgi:hypothetical protein
MGSPAMFALDGIVGVIDPMIGSFAAVPFDSSLPIVVGSAGVAAVSLLLWSQSGQRGFGIVIAAAVAVAGLAILADWAVETDREQVERLFPRLAVAAEAGDMATILDTFDPAALPRRAEAERALREVHPEEVRVTRLDVTVTGPADNRTARADMLVHVRGDAGATGMAGHVSALIDLAVSLRKVEGRFLIVDFDLEPARPIDRRPE